MEGQLSFANHFRSMFEISQGNDGMVTHEIPVMMVALVAIAVSDLCDCLSVSKSI